MIYNLGIYNTVLNQFVAEMRDKNIQKDSMRFRTNMVRVVKLWLMKLANFSLIKQ